MTEYNNNNNIPEGFTEITEGELGWDDEIEKDSPDFILLPEGDYDFIVTDFERGRHNGSEKLPPCAKAVVNLKIETPDGIAMIRHQLFLHTRTEGMLCSFFAGIGQRKKGEKLKMNWNMVPGSRGRAKVGIRKYTNDKGETRDYNEIKKFYEQDGTPVTPSQAAKGFTPGNF